MRKGIFLVLLVSLAIAAFLSPFASTSPDGLEWVAEDKGFVHLSEGREIVNSPMPDYLIPGMENETVAGSFAGVVGTILTFGIMFGIGKLYLKKARSHQAGGQ